MRGVVQARSSVSVHAQGRSCAFVHAQACSSVSVDAWARSGTFVHAPACLSMRGVVRVFLYMCGVVRARSRMRLGSLEHVFICAGPFGCVCACAHAFGVFVQVCSSAFAHVHVHDRLVENGDGY
jgi:hypothetical protein